MKKNFIIAATIGFAMASCGGLDQTQIDSGAKNMCELNELMEQLKADPSNLELQEKVKSVQGYLETNIELGGEGNEEAMKEAITAKAKEECGL